MCDVLQEKHVNVVFVGTRGLGMLKRAFLGSFSDYMVLSLQAWSSPAMRSSRAQVHHAPCSVMVSKLEEETSKAAKPKEPTAAATQTDKASIMLHGRSVEDV